MSRRTPFHLVAAIGIVAAAFALAVAVAKPAEALPSYKSTCSSCHSGNPSGTVTATPSKATLTAGEAYTVAVAINLSSSGNAGYWISSGNASTPAVNVTGGPGGSSFTANMKAPNAAGTYAYKVWAAKGKPSSGQALSTTYQITVEAGTGGGGGGGGGGTSDTVNPTVQAPSAAKVVKGKKATLKYQVDDADPNLGTAKAIITITNKAGKVVKTLRPAAVAVNAAQKATFTCRLAKGTYKFSVTATDAAGNLSSNTAVNKLTVKGTRTVRHDER